MKKVKFSNDTIKIKLIILIIFIIGSFFYIAYKLIDIVLLNNEKYFSELDKRENKTYISRYAARGRILDRHGNVLVDNKKVYVLNYVKKSDIDSLKEIELAKKISEFLELNYEEVTKENIINYYYILNKENIKLKANKNMINKLNDRTISNNEFEIYLKKLITESELNNLKEEDVKASYLFYLMNKGYRNASKLIKNNITEDEVNEIEKYYEEGFELGILYERIYPYKDIFKQYLGSLGSIPAEEVDSYLKSGYKRDEVVGISYLEKEYEDYLKGQNEEYTLSASGKKNIVKNLKNGKDITLSIDINLQKDIENIIYEQVIKAKKEANTKYYNKSYVIISDPNTGEILASAGIGVLNNKNNTKVDYLTDLSNYALTPGSIVKGASHLVGYKYGAIKIGYTVNDSCIKVKNTPKKCSWKNLGRINDLTALKYSSNYYQFLMAIKIGEGNYKYNAGLKLNTEGFNKYREVYNQFGLGVKTGLDIPNENIGYVGKDLNGGALLDYPIGQYETYTPMQLMQYINTLATSGKRYSLHYLKKVEDTDFNIKLLNSVNVDSKYISRVKEGLKMVMESGGTGRSHISPKYNSAGKTGTAQSFIDTNLDGKIDTETISSSFGAYIPYDNPKVSIVVLSPNVSDRKTSFTSKVNRKIAKEVTDLYFSKYN